MRSRLHPIVLSVALVALAACGGGGDGGGEKFADDPSAEFGGPGASAANTDENVLVRDDFSDSNSGWDEAETSDFGAVYSNGRFQITVKLKGLFGVSTTLYEGPRNRPELKELGEVNVELSAVGKPAKDGAFGVICRARGDPTALDYYGATVDADGRWRILRSQGDRQREELASGTSSAKFGSDPVRVRLECAGAQGQPARLRVFVNGRFRGEATDNAAWPSGGVGFAIASTDAGGVVAQLDDLVISGR